MTEPGLSRAVVREQTEVASAPMAIRLLRGTGWNSLAQLTPVVTSIVMTPFLLHHLGLARYGFFVVASTVISFLRQFDGGLGSTAIRFFAVQAGSDRRAETTRLLTSLTAIVAAVGALVVAVFWQVAPLVTHAFGVSQPIRAQSIFLLRMLSVLAVISVVAGLFNAVLIARQRFAWISVVSTVASMGSSVGAFLAVRAGDGLRALSIATAGQVLVTFLFVLPAACGWLDSRSVKPASRPELREFFHYASRVQVVSLGALITLETDNVIVGIVRGTRSVSFYSVGAGFALQLRQVVLNGLGPITAQLANSFGRRGQAAVADFENLQRAWVVVVTGWCAAGIGSGYVAMTVWLGPGYAVAGVVATVLGLSNMVNLWTGVTTAWLQTTGNPGIEARYASLNVVLNLVLTAVLVIPLGLYGILIGTAVSTTVASLYLLRAVRTGVSEPVRSFLLDIPVRSGLLCAAVTLLLEFGARPFLVGGAVGFLACGLLAVPGLSLFAFRERWLIRVVRSRQAPQEGC